MVGARDLEGSPKSNSQFDGLRRKRVGKSTSQRTRGSDAAVPVRYTQWTFFAGDWKKVMRAEAGAARVPAATAVAAAARRKQRFSIARDPT